MKKIYFAITILASIVILISCGSSRTIAIEEGWDLLGETKVNFVRDRDELAVTGTNRYTAIRFKVEGKDIILKDVKVVFQSGDKLEPLIEEEIKAGQYSKVVELAQEGKNISHIEFKYRSTGSIFKGRATVMVFGRRYPY